MEEKRVDKNHYRIISEHDKEDIINSVKNGESVNSVCRRLNISRIPVVRVLDENGIDHSHGNLNGLETYFPDGIYSRDIELSVMKQIQNAGYSKRNRKIYNIDHCYFDDPYREDKLYFLGFLYSDGYIQSNRNVINLSLKEEDRAILERINTEIKNETPLRYVDYSFRHDNGYTYSNQYRLQAYSYHMCRVVEALGAIQKKSLVLEFPRWLKPEWYRFFIRGVFDGDGSLFMNTKRQNTVVIKITSTENFCKALVDICAKYLSIRSHIYEFSQPNGITKVFTISGRQASKKFLDWIYNDATIYLQRKYDRYLDYYNINNSTQLNELVG